MKSEQQSGNIKLNDCDLLRGFHELFCEFSVVVDPHFFLKLLNTFLRMSLDKPQKTGVKNVFHYVFYEEVYPQINNWVLINWINGEEIF